MIDNGNIMLSVIIPYFETFELTWNLVGQLATQNDKKKFEIILIDDGCNENRFDAFGKLENIKVIHQENMGVAKTRNKGIDMAKGKYIAFIDSDDMITIDYIDTLLKAIATYDTDVINFNWYDMTDHIENRMPHNYAPWKAIYKKETIPKFREDREYGSEDIDFQIEIDSGKYSITYLDKLLYFYNSNREGSLIWKKNHKEKIK